MVFAFVALLSGESPTGLTAALVVFGIRYPSSYRQVRVRTTVRIDGDCVVMTHGRFGEPLVIERGELHSIVPVWLNPTESQVQARPSVVASGSVPMIGTARGRRN